MYYVADILAAVDGLNVLSIQNVTVVGVLLVVLWLIMTGRLVPGMYHGETVDENRRLKMRNDDLVRLLGASMRVTEGTALINKDARDVIRDDLQRERDAQAGQ